jgi:hypothetical protein
LLLIIRFSTFHWWNEQLSVKESLAFFYSKQRRLARVFVLKSEQTLLDGTSQGKLGGGFGGQPGL